MKAIMVMFDSLNRHFLPNYGCDWTVMPQFQRLERRKRSHLTVSTAEVCHVCLPAANCRPAGIISCTLPGLRCSHLMILSLPA